MIKRIMICDDSRVMRGFMKADLLRHGYEVVGEAENGKEAVKLFTEVKPDLLLLDISMPVMDGVAALKKIRKADKNARVIMLANIGQDKESVKCMKLGATGILTKAFTYEKFAELMETLEQP